MPQRISYAQNGEDVRIWHAFGPRDASDEGYVYVDVGANEPWHFSVTAALSQLGWRGILIEADPQLASRLRDERPDDVVVNAAAADRDGELAFFSVPGTGLGTTDAHEADDARRRGYTVERIEVPARRLDEMLDEHLGHFGSDIHVMTIDVEGAESMVLDGLTTHRPWVMCIEAVEPGSQSPSHHAWQDKVTRRGYVEVAFDGINRWYVAEERAQQPVPEGAGAPCGTTIAEAIATPFHVLDIGLHGWETAANAALQDGDNRSYKRISWQRELLANDRERRVPRSEYERQIAELRAAVVSVEGSRTFRLSRVFASAAKVVVGPFRRAAAAAKATPWVTRWRHLRHVNMNMTHLTHPAFLGKTATTGEQALPNASPFDHQPPGVDLTAFSPDDARAVRSWLNENPIDSDAELFTRLDNRNDEIGRIRSALRTRVRIREHRQLPIAGARGSRVAFDARSLQSPAFGNRGIGRFAAAALLAARESVPDERLTLIIDRGLEPLPDELSGGCEQVPRISTTRERDFAVLVSPSPMTHSPDPFLPLLLSDANSVAIVFDFIPMDYPDVYLPAVADRAEYAARLDALLEYREFICISHTVRDQLTKILRTRGVHEYRAEVAWPKSVAADLARPKERHRSSGRIVIASGDDARKNTFGGLAGVAAATVREKTRDVTVWGMGDQDDRVHHWSIAAAMRPGEAHTLSRVSDAELEQTLATADVVVVPSFAEGLSLPVIEALAQGTPVVASDIAAHRELIGGGPFLADPAKPRSIATAVARTRGRQGIARRQLARIARHRHAELENVIDDLLQRNAPMSTEASATRSVESASATSRGNRDRLRVALATPWAPQQSGVADYSVATGRALAEVCELTVFTTSNAELDLSGADRAIHAHKAVEELLSSASEQEFDAVIVVVGNSHFHLPFIELIQQRDCIVIAHDTRMIEYYLSLRGRGGAEQLMLRTMDPAAPRGIDPSLDDQIADMRLLQNAGLWEIARRSQALITHSPTTAERIERQTGVSPIVLPFVHYRPNSDHEVDELRRSEARARLQLTDDAIQLATFGFVDVRTKQVDMLLEAAGWLTSWGDSIALTIVGSAPEHVVTELTSRARVLGLTDFQITGFQSEDRYRDWLLAVDLGVQLRVSPYLGVSGPLADMAAVGTPALASSGLCRDVDTPSFIDRLPDVVSPVTLAEAIETRLAAPMPWVERNAALEEYLASHSPANYAAQLMEVIREVTR